MARKRITTAAELGACVRTARGATGLTLEQAAGLAGVGTRFLLELEHGKPTVRLGLVLQVLQRLGLELAISPRTGKST